MYSETDYQDQPGFGEILRIVREYLESIVDKVPDEDRYHAMCCAYLMTVAEREHAVDGADAVSLKQRADALLDACLPYPASVGLLAQRIREGACDTRWDDTFALVLAQVVNKVRVSKPEHLHQLHRESAG